MSLDSSANLPSGNLGFLSAGVMSIAAWVGLIAFTLVALQGCAPASMNASSAREPSAAVAGLGALRADAPTRSTTRQPAERPVADRSHSNSRDRGFRPTRR